MGLELTEAQKNSVRSDFYNKFVKNDIALYFSEPIQTDGEKVVGIPSFCHFKAACIGSEKYNAISFFTNT